MAHKKRRSTRRRRSNTSHRRRRSNPFGFSASGKHHKRHHRRRSRNPMGFGGDTGSRVLYGLLGGGASAFVPTLVPTWNTGWTGVGLSAATAWGGSLVVGKMLGASKGQDFLIGGLMVAAGRAITNLLGVNLLNPGMGFYVQNSYPLPTSGSGPFLLNSGYEGSTPMASIAAGATPAAMAAAAALPAGQGTDEPTRWGKWTA